MESRGRSCIPTVIDLHSHILPGLDDGAADWERSLAMARHAAADGISEIVCTPHWMPGKYENRRTEILARLEEFRARIAEADIPLTLHAGAELHLDAAIAARVRGGELLTLADGGRYILLELPEEALPDGMEDFFWNLQLEGLRPILSHVERNPVLRRDPARLRRWVETGVLTQITAASLAGRFSNGTREFALQLLKQRLAHVLATDAHGMSTRKPELSAALKEVEAVVGAEAANRMVRGIPEKILRGESVEPDEPLPFEEPAEALPFMQRLRAIFRGSGL